MEATKHEARSVQFIREAGHHDDRFGAHSRLATAMHEALLIEPHLEVIGLFGAWGSGKSTVIKLLEKRMASDTSRFFTYDAWVHQSDAPRRAFLEALIRFLQHHKLANVETLDHELARLLQREEIVEVESRPELSISGGLVVSLFLAAPAAAIFLREGWRIDSGDYFFSLGEFEFNTIFWIALIFSTLPFLAITTVNICRLFQLVRRRKSDGFLASLFANKAKEVRRDTRRTNPEPTALEFQRFFRSILATVDPTRTQRLIFVVDNLDRLPDTEMMALWGSVRGLFHGERNAPLERLPTLILPLDFEALRRAHKDEGGEIAQGFADKTFDVVFRVPTPVLSQWQEYLRQRMTEVFGEGHDPQWPYVAARVLEATGSDHQTPRAVNTFVNELATLWLQWRDEDISLAAMAYYVTHRSKLEPDAWSHLRHSPSWMNDLDPRWTRGVAAIRYGAPPDVAEQILIEQPLRDAINAMNDTEFDDLMARPGAHSVVRRLCDEMRQSAAGTSISNLALLLAKVDRGDDPVLTMAWDALAQCVAAGADWVPRRETDVTALHAILSHASARARVTILYGVCGRFVHMPEGDLIAGAAAAVGALRRLASVADEMGLAMPTATAPGAARAALALAAEMRAQEANWIRPQGAAAGLLASLPQHFLAASPGQIRGTLEVLKTWYAALPWEAYSSAFARSIPDSMSGSQIQGLYEIFLFDADARPSITELVRGQEYRDALLHSSLEYRDVSRALSLCIAARIPPPSPSQGWADVLAKRPDLGALIASDLNQLAPQLTAMQLVRGTLNGGSAALLAAVLEAQLERGSISLVADELLRELPLIAQMSPSIASILWARANEDDLAEALKRAPSDVARRALSALAGSAPTVPSAIPHLERYLNGVSTQEWAVALREGGDVLSQLETLRAATPELPVSGEFQVAVQETGRELFKAGAPPTKEDAAWLGRWLSAVRTLPEPAQQDVLNEGIDLLVRSGPRAVRHLVSGDETLLSAALARSPEQVFAWLLVPNFAQLAVANFVADHSQILVTVVHRLSAETRRSLQIALSTVLNNSRVTTSKRVGLEALRAHVLKTQ